MSNKVFITSKTLMGAAIIAVAVIYFMITGEKTIDGSSVVFDRMEILGIKAMIVVGVLVVIWGRLTAKTGLKG